MFSDTVDSITPNKMKGVRTILNSSAMDILYYTSPLYRSEVSVGWGWGEGCSQWWCGGVKMVLG